MVNDASLFLIPTPIHDSGIRDITMYTSEVIKPIRHFVVEDIKTARRVLRKMGYTANFDNEVSFYELNKHDTLANNIPIIEWMKQKYPIGLMSEAGLPCIADPGSRIVQLAHDSQYRIVPLSGPSSIILALISSGMSGQNFAFNGYLPIDKKMKLSAIKRLESRVLSEGQTQLWMETPYRNTAMLQDIIQSCQPTTTLSIASNIGADDMIIRSHSIAAWKNNPLPEIHKKPTIFAIGK